MFASLTYCFETSYEIPFSINVSPILLFLIISVLFEFSVNVLYSHLGIKTRECLFVFISKQKSKSKNHAALVYYFVATHETENIAIFSPLYSILF